jgi:hypothetical protein
MSFMARPAFSGFMLGITIAVYLLNVLIFNEVHLRLKRERVSLVVLLFYYVGLHSSGRFLFSSEISTNEGRPHTKWFSPLLT